MKKSLKLFLPLLLVVGSLFAQSIEANWQLNAAIVEYTYEVRDSASADDAIAGYEVTASWPSSAMAAAGYGYTHTLADFEIGDTITVALVPLVNETLLQMAGVNMNVDLNDDGTFTINEGSTYPTTETVDCSTFATVPSVTEAGTWISTPGYTHPDDPNAYSMGWGISLSSVFAQFNAPDLVGGTYGEDYGVGTDMENWGMVTIDYNDDAHSIPQDLEIYWEAHDGTTSGLGVDDIGELNGHTGVPVVGGDTVTISNIEMYLAYVHPDTNLWYDLGWTGMDNFSVPMLGGEGHPVDPSNPATYEIDPITGDTIPAGMVESNWGYLFDPAGDDGIPFSGDEPLQATGYFFTYNFLEAVGTFTGVFEAMSGGGADITTSLEAAADSIAEIYLDDPYADAVAEGVADTLIAMYTACITAGGTACEEVFEAGPTLTLMGVKTACAGECGVDDSGYDFDEEDGVGRLIFEVDNNCIPDNTTQRVNTFWYNTAAVDVDEEAPIAQKFELFGNFPNPFNPSTKIRFATEKMSHVNLTIYSVLGEKVATVHDGVLSPGTYDITWNGVNNHGQKVPSGVYFYEVKSDHRSHRGKMLMLK